MTHMEAIAALAQGVINIASADGKPHDEREALALIEKGSRIYRGMVALCREEPLVVDQLRALSKMIRAGQISPRAAEQARELIGKMIAQRTEVDAPPILIEKEKHSYAAPDYPKDGLCTICNKRRDDDSHE